MLVVVLILCSCVFLQATPEVPEHGAFKHSESHYKDGIHNPVFDQEALLGSHNVDDLAELPNDVRIKRLRNLAKSHDSNNNDIIELDELKEWILQSFRMLDREEAMEKLQEEDENGDKKVTFAEILGKRHGYGEEDLPLLENYERGDEDVDVLELINDDKKRFLAADLDKDGALSQEEYVAYFQPYDFPHMFQVEMERSMHDIDKDADGFISMEEFIGENVDDETRISEMTNFEELDKDKDGKLTPDELRPWALPDNEDVAKEEAEHLLNMCDLDRDGKLSIEEIVNKEEEFIGSSATDYGRTLHFVRDEL
ncbi:reticulocalbin-2-like [Biomphalaria glabrata]|uniref:Reticulocalbin-2-like n=1 Tax=Biomphalaria glabrata TaxID=6526 RepID=A0A9W3AFS6_BIOGL|nr:reticulocalbin-2-like [Biomphalaria glabrata]